MDQNGIIAPSAPLIDVHTALAAAAQESQGLKIKPLSFRLGRYGFVAAKICISNGTTLSGFLRKCCEALAKDYGVEIDHLPPATDEGEVNG